MSSEGSGMSVSDYALHRKCSDSYVRRMRRSGRLVFTPGGLIDALATDALLAASSDPMRGGNRTQSSVSDSGAFQPDGREAAIEPGTLRHAMQRERAARAGIAELELGEKAGDLIRKKDAMRTTFTLARKAIERFQSVGHRLCDKLAAESTARGCQEILEKEFIEVSEEMKKFAVEIKSNSQATVEVLE